MVVFPHCKINIGLQVLNKRTDGYHNLCTVFYPVPLKDALEIIRNPVKTDEPVQFTQSGISIEGDSAANLCVKAYYLLKADFPALPAIQMHLHKAIPMGAGLGGGSADGAFALSLLNKQFDLGLDTTRLIQYALQLGSDCPFFIMNNPCIATGRGEIMEPLTLDLSGYQLILINTGVHINTGWAFKQLAASNAPGAPIKSTDLKVAITDEISTWSEHISNDFELPVFTAHPELLSIKKQLYSQGAIYAAMSGSGSTIYGLFKGQPSTHLILPEGCFVRTLVL